MNVIPSQVDELVSRSYLESCHLLAVISGKRVKLLRTKEAENFMQIAETFSIF